MEVNTMKKFESKLLILLFVMLMLPMSFALTLQEAKNEGIVGERIDGYVGLVENSAAVEVVAMVRDVNNQRRALYQQIARENNLSVDQVAALAYEKAVEATPSGQYVQDATGAWATK